MPARPRPRPPLSVVASAVLTEGTTVGSGTLSTLALAPLVLSNASAISATSWPTRRHTPASPACAW